MIDIDTTIIRQYFTSPRMRRILTDFMNNMDGQPFVDLLTENVLDPRTATGWGLDVWGRIVGVSRYLDVAQDKYLGFAEAANLSSDTFGHAIWYNGQTISGNALYLADAMYRKMIFAKAWANISDCSVRSINGCLQLLFSDVGKAYVRDNLDRTVTFVLGFTPDPSQISIIEKANVIPTPAGVSFTYEVAA